MGKTLVFAVPGHKILSPLLHKIEGNKGAEKPVGPIKYRQFARPLGEGEDSKLYSLLIACLLN